MSDKILAKIKDIQKNIFKLKKQTEDIPVMKVAVLDANEIIKCSGSMQGHHGQALDLLSRPFINHDARLRSVR